MLQQRHQNLLKQAKTLPPSPHFSGSKSKIAAALMLSKQRESHYQNHLQLLQKKLELQKQKRKNNISEFDEALQIHIKQRHYLQQQAAEMTV